MRVTLSEGCAAYNTIPVTVDDTLLRRPTGILGCPQCIEAMVDATMAKEFPCMSEGTGGTEQVAAGPRGWGVSVFVALIGVGIGVTLSATINPLLDRRVHWDWTAPLAVALLVLLTTAVRRRWV
jgi:hypothetical protein